MNDYARRIAEELDVRVSQTAAAIELLDQDNTLPFIARYRKEATGGLDEEQLRQLSARLDQLRALDERRQTIMASIEEQGQMTPELLQKLLAAETRTELEDLYQPYKPKRRTRAGIAREKGLEGLAELILEQARTEQSLQELAAPFLSEEVSTVEEAWAGARDIVAEVVSDHPEVRGGVRERALRWGLLGCQKSDKAEDPREVYNLYYDFEHKVDRLRPHQVLAINRGESEGVLRVGLELAEYDWKAVIDAHFRPQEGSPLAGQLALAIEDGAQRLLLPAIERDVRRLLTEQAMAHAIEVFAQNLRGLLSQPPLAGYKVLGIDPGYRTGCKVAVVSPTGKVLDTVTMYPHPPQREWERSLEILADLVRRHRVKLVAIGNGTASRETEQLVAELIERFKRVRYLLVSEAGASVYSASPLARAELPDMDVSMRGAVSIARRVLDPLAELVKIDPRSIGVGMYQHDVEQKQLQEALGGVVESVVNQVGVDLNTASPALLTYVSGIGPKLAKRIVAHRNRHGPFRRRQDLLEVSGLGPKTFEQAAGFLRIREGENPLDGSAIHPESYSAAEALLDLADAAMDMAPERRQAALDRLRQVISPQELAAELGVGLPTLQDILEQLVRPGRDPREDLPPPVLRSDVLSMDDLEPGLRLKGTVRNVVDFGAFVDIGVKQDGLLHRSQWPQGRRPEVGEVIEVEILNVDPDRGRIGLGWAGLT
ncbi:MAG: RNA-binding transcriptional accessory protein [Chloroflexia bacterium]|nr:RNA-binding transcriptional accessory protein [Chloroflexia bacterium]